jgi:glycosyltransferase involved in cell wall biosynthesis
MSQPTVTVIIPVFNREDMIERAVRSVIDQTWKTVQLIVVDDGSTDRTPEVLRQFTSHALVLTQPNRGAYPARNLALQHARGELIAFLDSDDAWLPQRLEKQVALMNAAPSVDLVYSNGRVVFVPPRPIERTLFDIARPHRGQAFEQLVRHNFIPTSSVLVRAQTFTRHGPFLELPLAADYHKWLQIAHTANIDYCDEVLFEYTLHETGISRDRAKSWVNIQKVYEDLLRTLPSTPRTQAMLTAQVNKVNYWAALSASQSALRWTMRGLRDSRVPAISRLANAIRVALSGAADVLRRLKRSR